MLSKLREVISDASDPFPQLLAAAEEIEDDVKQTPSASSAASTPSWTGDLRSQLAFARAFLHELHQNLPLLANISVPSNDPVISDLQQRLKPVSVELLTWLEASATNFVNTIRTRVAENPRLRGASNLESVLAVFSQGASGHIEVLKFLCLTAEANAGMWDNTVQQLASSCAAFRNKQLFVYLKQLDERMSPVRSHASTTPPRFRPW